MLSSYFFAELSPFLLCLVHFTYYNRFMNIKCNPHIAILFNNYLLVPSLRMDSNQEQVERDISDYQMNEMDWIIKPEPKESKEGRVGGLAISNMRFC